MNYRVYCILITVILCVIGCNCQDIEANSYAAAAAAEAVPDSQKLNIILTSLARIERKQDSLSASFANIKQEACGCLPQAARTFETSRSDAEESASFRSTRQVSGNPTTSPTNDRLFHMNRLATGENLIPSSSSSDWNTAAVDAENSADKQQSGIEVPVYYALDGFSRLLKEQLTSFRSSLHKLMVRVVDHSYQYQLILNKLSLIREECSLAASLSLADKQDQESVKTKEQKQAVDTSVSNTMRSSDVALIVRLLSSELSHIIDAQHLLPSTRAADLGAIVNETNALMLDRLSGIFANESRILAKRLDEIDSVSKQSALMLSKLWNLQPALARSDQVAVVVDVTNSNDTSVASVESASKQTTQAQSSQTTNKQQPQQQQQRWFPGSRVPGRPANEQPTNVSPRQRSSKQTGSPSGQTKRKCQSKTNLVRPTSCQELRIAGANCTGQYYVFLRGNIRHVYCDMNMDSRDDGGGWTVVLRRIDKSLGHFVPLEDDEQQQQQHQQAANSSPGRQVNPLMEAFKASQLDFRLDWSNYRTGFGQLNDWAEFFVGLDMLHQLTDRNSSSGSGSSSIQLFEEANELQIDLEFSDGERMHLKFDNFSVGNEESKFQLEVSGCNATEPSACLPVTGLDGSWFYTRDNLTQPEVTNLSAPIRESLATGFGWWIPTSTDHWLPLTMPVGAQSGGGSESTNARHMYWPGYAHDPLKRIIMKVRAKRSRPPLTS